MGLMEGSENAGRDGGEEERRQGGRTHDREACAHECTYIYVHPCNCVLHRAFGSYLIASNPESLRAAMPPRRTWLKPGFAAINLTVFQSRKELRSRNAAAILVV